MSFVILPCLKISAFNPGEAPKEFQFSTTPDFIETFEDWGGGSSGGFQFSETPDFIETFEDASWPDN